MGNAAAPRLAPARPALTTGDLVNLALREYSERRARTGARARHFAQAQRWDDHDFWQQHETSMSVLFADLYPDVSVPTGVWRWIDSAQSRLAQRGRHQALSVVDRLICAVAARHDLVVLHDDHDFRTAAVRRIVSAR